MKIEVLSENISVQGCAFTRTALVFERRDVETITRAGALLQEVGNAEDWWWGDYLQAYAELRLDDEGHGAADEPAKAKLRAHYVRNHASVLNGRELAETQLERWKVAGFYNSGSRLPELSNEHHRVAMDGSDGDVAIAQEWLSKAQVHGWSRNELRAEIKGAKRPVAIEGAQAVQVQQQELFAFKRFARAAIKRVDDMEQQEMEALLADLQPALMLATRLAERLGREPIAA
jgi:hypothetical protein